MRAHSPLLTAGALLCLNFHGVTAFPLTKRISTSSHLTAPKCTNNKVSILRVSAGGASSSDKSSPLQSSLNAPSAPASLQKIRAFTQRNFFLLGMVFAVGLARTFPSLGANGGLLRPELLIGKFGVMTIFLLSGLSLELSELKAAASNHKLNGLVQAASFLAWPFLVGVPLTKGLAKFAPGLLPPPLLDGLLILCCLPTTVNMCVFLTSAAGGSVASSLCNAVIGNMLGIFVTPALLLRFFGKSIEVPFAAMIGKLCGKVLLPVAVGQMLRKTGLKEVYTDNSKKFKRLQEIILLGIVWNAFCNAFTKGLGLNLSNSVVMLGIVSSLHLLSMAGLFALFQSKFIGFTREQVVASTFCASHKTLAFGLPLVNTIFEGNPNLAAYCAPIMFVHPLQLVLGSLLVPKFAEYISSGKDNGDGIKKDS